MATCPFCARAVDAAPGTPVTCPSCGARFSAGGTMPEEQIPANALPPQVPMAPSPMSASPEIPCPMCGEMIKVGARLCRFCKSPLDAGGGAMGPRPMGRPAVSYGGGGGVAPLPKKTNCLLWAILGILGLIVLVCVGVGVVVYLNKDKVTDLMCKQYLGEIHKAALVYERNAPKGDGIDELRGGEFVRKVSSKSDNDQIMYCPSALFKGKQIVYRGPKKPWSKMKEDDIVACDQTGSHGKGIWILHRSGLVEFADSGSDLYKRALDETQD